MNENEIKVELDKRKKQVLIGLVFLLLLGAVIFLIGEGFSWYAAGAILAIATWFILKLDKRYKQ